MLFVWMGFWRASIQRGWPERQVIAAFLRSLPAASTVFCDEATVEILSGLDRHRFDRHWVDDPHTWELVAADARTRGVAYVATWERKLAGHENAGTVVLRTRQVDAQPNSALAVMRVATDEARIDSRESMH
jgi:precorrin isomerase